MPSVQPAPQQAVRQQPPQVVIKDTVMTRNRGCGDLILYGFLFLVIIVIGGCTALLLVK